MIRARASRRVPLPAVLVALLAVLALAACGGDGEGGRTGEGESYTVRRDLAYGTAGRGSPPSAGR